MKNIRSEVVAVTALPFLFYSMNEENTILGVFFFLR